MKNCSVLSLLAAAIIAFHGCGEEVDQPSPGVEEGGIVRVGDAVLTEDDLDNLLPTGEKLPFTPEEKRLFAERWVDTEILCREAIKRGLGDDPRIRFRLEALEREILSEHLVYLELRDRTWVSEREIEDNFNKHKKEYLYEYRVSHILVNTLEEAEKVAELLGRRSFAWVANRHSVDPVAGRGGDLGYLTKGNMIPEFENVIFGMKAGEISNIVKSDFGYHIIKLVGMRESLVKVGLEDVRENIMNALVIEKREKAYRDFLDSLRSLADIEYIESEYKPGMPVDRDSAAGEHGEVAGP